MTDLDDNIFRLSYFERKHNFYSREDLYNEIYMHYFSQGVKQLYVVLFGAEFLGNPFGLVVGATRGVEDLFYEPFVGAVEGTFFDAFLQYFTKKGHGYSVHRVDITEGASAQFLTWIFNFWPYGQLRAVMEKKIKYVLLKFEHSEKA